LPGIHSHHQAVAAIDKPTIAAVRGWTVAGGLELALACDIRVAAEDAKLGMMEVRRGRLGGAGGTQRLPRLIGTAKALEICLTGEPIDAAEAYRVGLVNHVVPADQLMPTATAIANKICLGAPLSLIAIKEAITKGVELSLDEGLKLESELAMLLSNTEDQKEGSRAFAEKRPPQWKGR
jgi:enoyl-CoA hydratase/carnithine racemase